MAFPRYRDIELPLLYELANAGGVTTPSALYPRVATHFPRLTAADLNDSAKSGSENKWNNMVRWARNELTKNGEIEPVSVSGRGTWKISELGMARLARERHLLPLSGAGKQTLIRDSAVDYEDQMIALQEVRTNTQRQLVSIGSIFRRYALPDFRQDRMQYDVIWKQAQRLPVATHCFQVDAVGRLPSALPVLKLAHDMWGANLFLVATDETEADDARERLMPHFTQQFQEIGAVANILTANDVNDLHDAISPRHDLISTLLRD